MKPTVVGTIHRMGIAFILLALIGQANLPSARADEPAAQKSIRELQVAREKELSALQDQYDSKINQPGSNKSALLRQYEDAVDAVRKKYLDLEARAVAAEPSGPSSQVREAAPESSASFADESGVGEIVPATPPSEGAAVDSGIEYLSLDQFTPKIESSQVQMPGPYAPGERPTKWVTGDAALADLAEPGVKHLQGPPANPELAEIVRNIPPPPSAPKVNPADVQMPHLAPGEKPVKYVSGDVAEADLLEPGVKHLQAPPPDADLAALARGELKPSAKVQVSSPQPPASEPVASRAVANARTAQAAELEALREEFAGKARQTGANQADLMTEYTAKADAIKKKYLANDTRAAEIKDIKERFGGEIDNTGSNPKDVRADVDLAAKNDAAARKLADEWRAKNDVVKETDTKYVNETRDATLWKPETPETAKSKVHDFDAFSTEGGREGTGNKSAVRDELGWQIDNEKKFLHSQLEGDIKTTAKSVDKAAEATGVKRFDPNAKTMVMDPETGKMVPSERVKGGFVRDSGIKKQNSDFYQQAETLRKYGDDAQAGVTDLADTPEVRQQKLNEWNKEAGLEMDKSRSIAERRSAVRDGVRENFQQSLENATPADQANLDANARDAAAINDQRTRVRESNLAGENKNMEYRHELEASKGAEPSSELTKAPAVGGAAGGESFGTMVRRNVGTANEVVGAAGLAGQFGEAGTKQAGQAIDQNRDFTAGDAGQALLDGSGIPGMYKMGHDISAEEQARVEKGEQGQVRAVARTGLRTGDVMARDMINNPGDRAIREEEARAAAAGEEPDYIRSWANGSAESLGKLFGISAVANAVEEPSTYEARGAYAAQRDAMGQFVDDHVRESTHRIRTLQGELEQLSLNGDVKNPDTQAQIQQRLASMDEEYDKLNRLSGMASRTLGKEDPDTVSSMRQQLASLPKANDFKGYVGQVVADRSGTGGAVSLARTSTGPAEVPDAGPTASKGLNPLAVQRIANDIAADQPDILASPKRADGGSFVDTLKGLGQRVKDEAENQVIKSVVENPQPYVRGALQGLNAESDDSRRIRQMYNAAPEGSDDRKKLNSLFEQLRDAKTPDERAAAQAAVGQWSQKYPPAQTSETLAPAVPVVPTRDELQTARDEAAANVQRSDDYIRQLQENGGSKEDIDSAQWVRDQEQQRLNGYNQSLNNGEFQKPPAPAGGSVNSTPAATATTLAPAGSKPPEGAGGLSDASAGIQPETPEERRSPGGWTADQLQNDNYNMQNLAGDAEGRIKNLEQQIADSHNSTEKKDLQAQIDKERTELNGLQDRINGNNSELTAMGAATGTGEKPKGPSPWTADQLQNDNYNMQNLAGDTQDRIKNLEQQIADSHNSTEKKDLQAQVDKERTELNGLQGRINDNNSDLTDMGAATGTGPGPWTPDQLRNDNNAMQNLAEQTQGQIDDLEQRIKDSRNGSERHDLQDELTLRRNELDGLQSRIDKNNSQLSAQGESADAGAEAGDSVFGGGTEPGTPEDGNLADSEPEYGGGEAESPEVNPDTDGGIQQFARATQDRFTESGDADMNLVKVSTEGRIAETRSDVQVDNADNVRDQGGADAQATVDNGVTEVAAGDRENSWGNVMGNAVQQGFEQGGQALGTAVGSTAGDRITGQVFGPTATDSSSSSGNTEGNNNGDDAGQGNTVASGSSPSLPPPKPQSTASSGSTCSDGCPKPPSPPPPPTAVKPPAPAPSTPAPTGGGMCPNCHIPLIKCSDGVWRCPNSGWVKLYGASSSSASPAIPVNISMPAGPVSVPPMDLRNLPTQPPMPTPWVK